MKPYARMDGLSLGGVEGSLSEIGKDMSDGSRCSWNLKVLPAVAKAGITLDYMGFDVTAALLSVSGQIAIPLADKDKDAYLGLELYGYGVSRSADAMIIDGMTTWGFSVANLFGCSVSVGYGPKIVTELVPAPKSDHKPKIAKEN